MLVTCAGILVCDIIATNLSRVSNSGEVTFAPNGIKLCIGGHSANVAINLIKLGLPKTAVSLVGAVGKDLLGDFMENELKKNYVITHLERVQEVGTSINLILIVKGQDRRFHIDVGANYWLNPDHVRAVLNEEKPLIFYVGATGMLGKFDEQLAGVLQVAKKLNCVTFVDPIAPYKHGYNTLLSALKWIDILHCNNIEASDMTNEKEPEDAIESLVRGGVKLVVITMGEHGLSARTRKIALNMPAFRVSAIDPTGAGDAFCAGMIYRLLQIMHLKPLDISKVSAENLTHVLLEGEAAGASCVTGVGTTTAVTRENVDKLLKKQGSTILKHTLIKIEEL
jgi:fructokinase